MKVLIFNKKIVIFWFTLLASFSSYSVESGQIDEYVDLSIILDRSNLKFDGYIELDKKRIVGIKYDDGCE